MKKNDTIFFYIFFRQNFCLKQFVGGVSPCRAGGGAVNVMVPPHAINSKICTTNPLKSAHLSLHKNPFFIRGGSFAKDLK